MIKNIMYMPHSAGGGNVYPRLRRTRQIVQFLLQTGPCNAVLLHTKLFQPGLQKLQHRAGKPAGHILARRILPVSCVGKHKGRDAAQTQSQRRNHFFVHKNRPSFPPPPHYAAAARLQTPQKSCTISTGAKRPRNKAF